MMPIDKEYPVRVKIKFDDRGERVHRPKWHYVIILAASEQTLCTGEVFGYGEGDAVYEKSRGKITCPDCIKIITKLKKVKL